MGASNAGAYKHHGPILPNKAIASYTSSTPQNDVGNYSVPYVTNADASMNVWHLEDEPSASCRCSVVGSTQVLMPVAPCGSSTSATCALALILLWDLKDYFP